MERERKKKRERELAINCPYKPATSQACRNDLLQPSIGQVWFLILTLILMNSSMYQCTSTYQCIKISLYQHKHQSVSELTIYQSNIIINIKIFNFNHSESQNNSNLQSNISKIYLSIYPSIYQKIVIYINLSIYRSTNLPII